MITGRAMYEEGGPTIQDPKKMYFFQLGAQFLGKLTRILGSENRGVIKVQKLVLSSSQYLSW